MAGRQGHQGTLRTGALSDQGLPGPQEGIREELEGTVLPSEAMGPGECGATAHGQEGLKSKTLLAEESTKPLLRKAARQVLAGLQAQEATSDHESSPITHQSTLGIPWPQHTSGTGHTVKMQGVPPTLRPFPSSPLSAHSRATSRMSTQVFIAWELFILGERMHRQNLKSWSWLIVPRPKS